MATKQTTALRPRDLITVVDGVVQPVLRTRRDPRDYGDNRERWLVTTGDSADHHGSTIVVGANREFVVHGTKTGRITRTPSALERSLSFGRVR